MKTLSVFATALMSYVAAGPAQLQGGSIWDSVIRKREQMFDPSNLHSFFKDLSDSYDLLSGNRKQKLPIHNYPREPNVERPKKVHTPRTHAETGIITDAIYTKQRWAENTHRLRTTRGVYRNDTHDLTPLEPVTTSTLLNMPHVHPSLFDHQIYMLEEPYPVESNSCMNGGALSSQVQQIYTCESPLVRGGEPFRVDKSEFEFLSNFTA